MSYRQQSMKKVLEETQTLHAGCSKAEPKKFRPAADPLPRAQDGQNLISWRWSLPSPTDPVWWRSMHVISSYRGNRPTNTHTHKQTHRQDRLQYTAPQLASAQCNERPASLQRVAKNIISARSNFLLRVVVHVITSTAVASATGDDSVGHVLCITSQ